MELDSPGVPEGGRQGREPEPGELSPIEASIMKWTGFPATGRQIYQPDGTPFKSVSTLFWHGATGKQLPARRRTGPHEEDMRPLSGQIGCQLVCPSGDEAALILALVDRLGAGPRSGRVPAGSGSDKREPIVAVVLCPMGLIGVIALAFACLHFPRISRRGRAYLEQLELAYNRLTSKGRQTARSGSTLNKAGDPDDREPTGESSVFSDRLLMNGIFGRCYRRTRR